MQLRRIFIPVEEERWQGGEMHILAAAIANGGEAGGVKADRRSAISAMSALRRYRPERSRNRWLKFGDIPRHCSARWPTLKLWICVYQPGNQSISGQSSHSGNDNNNAYLGGNT